MLGQLDVIDSDPEILGGTPVFAGTRVPAQTLFDYLRGGHSLAEFLDDFPSVKREQAIAVLDKIPADPDAIWSLEQIEFFLEHSNNGRRREN